MDPKPSVVTRMKLAALEVPVALFKATGDGARGPELEKAGPSGGALTREGDEKKDALLGPGSFKTPRGRSRSQKPYVEEGTGEIVEAGEERVGVRRSEGGEFVDLTDHLATLDKELALDHLEITGFLARNSVPRERIIGHYWVGLDGNSPVRHEGARALLLIFKALRNSRRVALARWTKRTKQAFGVISPHGSGSLLLEELAYADEARPAPEICTVIQNVETSEDDLMLAEQLIDQMAAQPRDLEGIVNPRVAGRLELVITALAGKLEEAPRPPEPEPEDDLEALADVLEEAGV